MISLSVILELKIKDDAVGAGMERCFETPLSGLFCLVEQLMPAGWPVGRASQTEIQPVL